MKIRNQITRILILLTLTIALPFDSLGQGKGKGGPPSWAPANGYRAKTRHVYFPDYNFYFDVQKGVYIYLNGSNWQISAKLPSLIAGIDLRSTVKVELELNTDTPQKYNDEHKTKYKAKGKDGQSKVKNDNNAKSKKK